tara:strand:+ start:816 stop:971 length:156 start_codon:yes stop_codon:yes gene_type:complete
METPISRLHQDMRDMWNDAPKSDKKKIIQEIMHDDIPSNKEELKEETNLVE